jgi:hypothetical protein
MNPTNASSVNIEYSEQPDAGRIDEGTTGVDHPSVQVEKGDRQTAPAPRRRFFFGGRMANRVG